MRKSDIIVLKKIEYGFIHCYSKKTIYCACDFLFGASYHKFIKKSFSY